MRTYNLCIPLSLHPGKIQKSYNVILTTYVPPTRMHLELTTFASFFISLVGFVAVVLLARRSLT